MIQATDCTSSGFTAPFFSTLTASKITKGVLAVVLAFSLLESTAIAQEEPVMIIPRAQAASGDSTKPNPSSTEPSPQTPATSSGTQQPAAPAAQNQPADSTLVLPAGTKLPLGLVRPLSLKSSSAKGTGVYLQVTFPVIVAGRMVVPPGAYVQGTIEKMTVKRSSNPDLEFEIRSASLIFSTGYTASLTGTVQMVHNNARLMPPGTPNTTDGTVVAAIPRGTSNVPSPAMSAVGTAPTPAPLPSLGNGPRNAIIAVGAVGAAALVGVTVFALHHRNDVYLDAGTPLEITLAEPLKLDASNVTTAVQQYSAQMATAPPEIVKPPERPKMCYDPGTSGTPDTRIPGTPPTPPTVIPGVNGAPDTVIPGSPGTPDTVIPGTPGTPGSWHRCP